MTDHPAILNAWINMGTSLLPITKRNSLQRSRSNAGTRNNPDLPYLHNSPVPTRKRWDCEGDSFTAEKKQHIRRMCCFFFCVISCTVLNGVAAPGFYRFINPLPSKNSFICRRTGSDRRFAINCDQGAAGLPPLRARMYSV